MKKHGIKGSTRAKSHAKKGSKKIFWLSIHKVSYFAIVAIIAAGGLISGNNGNVAKVDVTGTGNCNYSVGISGASSSTAGITAWQDVSIYPTNCTASTATATIVPDTSPAGTTVPPCALETTPLSISATGVTKTRIGCTSIASTLNGYYKYWANFTFSNGGSSQSTWFSFNITNGTESLPAAPSGLTATYSTENMGQREVRLTVTDNASNETYNQLYWRLSGTAWPSTAPKDTYSTAASTWTQPVNVGGIQIFAPTTAGTYEYQLWACNTAGCSSSNIASVVVPGTTPATSSGCTSLDFKLTDNKTSYTGSDFVNYSYICIPAGTSATSVTIQLQKPDGTSTTYNSGSNIGSVLQQMGFSTSNLTAGSYILKACLNSATCAAGSVYSAPFTLTGGTTTTTTTTTAGPTLMGTIFKDGQYVDQTTSTLRNCVSPNYWMKEGITSSGARSWHCMPIMGGNAATSNDYPPTPCVGTLWAGSNGSTSTTAVATDYCAATPTTSTTGTTGTTTPTTTTPPATTTTTTTTTPSSCANGSTCAKGSWCSNGQSFYYPNGDITCVAWSMGPGAAMVEAPAGTSECKPDDTNCVPLGKTVPYNNSKWCSRGMSYYSTDGKNMMCVFGMTSPTPPAGYTSCRPDDKQCITTGGYGSSSGWCSNGMKFYQIAKDDNPNNDTYCAAYNYPAAGTSGTAAMGPVDPPTPPAGYSACSSTDTNCKQKGDKWTGLSNSIYCTSAQKCSTATGGLCVGWSEVCPAGTKYCTDDSPNCIEPGETKTIAYAPGSTTTGYWCGGGSGMTFYSSTQVYCAPKKAGSNMMWVAADMKEILGRLGSGWGVCRPNEPNCIEPGKTGPSNGWCGWYPPGAYTMPATNANAPRTCPGFDDTGTVTPSPAPKPEPEPKPVQCPATITLPLLDCKPGFLPKTKTNSDGCVINECAPIGEVQPKPFPPPAIPPLIGPPEIMPPGNITLPGYNQCRMLRENNRGNKYEIRRIEDMVKSIPKGASAPSGLVTLLDQAKKAYGDTDQFLANATKCTDDIIKQGQEKVAQVSAMMQSLRDQSQSLQTYAQFGQFTRMLTQRIASLTNDISRLAKHNKSAAAKLTNAKEKLVSILKRAQEAAPKGDEFTLQDLQEELGDTEFEIQDIFSSSATEGKQSYVKESIANIQFGLAKIKEQITDKKKDIVACQKLNDLVTQVENSVANAQAAYERGDEKVAAETLDKTERFKDIVKEGAKQCGITVALDEVSDATRVYQGISGLDESAVASAADLIISRVTDKFQSLLDEKLAEITAKVGKIMELSSALESKIADSIAQLKSIPEAKRDQILAAKTTITETVNIVSDASATLGARNTERLKGLLTDAAQLNLCGDVATNFKAQTEAMRTKVEQKDATSDDISLYEKYLTAAKSSNGEACYKNGISRFRDAEPHAWYFGYTQDDRFFRGTMDANGNPTGRVEPGRASLGAEGLIALERALGYGGVNEQCDLAGRSAISVPTWANCGFNKAIQAGVGFTRSLSEPVTRQDVARWIVALAGDKLPVAGNSTILNGFKDAEQCRGSESAVAKVLVNKIMTGGTGENAGSWGCNKPLVRAELGAILARLADLLSITSTAVTPQ